MGGPMQQDRPALTWVGITNDILDTSPNGPTRAPLVLSAHDASELLASFQRLVYLTVLLSEGTGRRKVRQLSRAEKHQYELVLEDLQIGSLLAGFRFHEDIRDLWDSANNTAIATIQWSSELARTLSSSERIAVAADKVPDVLAVVGPIMIPILEVLAGHAIAMDAEQAIACIGGLAALVRLSRNTNRRLTARHGDTSWHPPKAQVDAVLNFDEALHDAPNSRIKTEERPFPQTRGTVEDSEITSHKLNIRFPQFSERVLCQYAPSDAIMLGRLQEGDSIEVAGVALYAKGDPSDAKPLLVNINDWTGLEDHQFPGWYKA